MGLGPGYHRVKVDGKMVEFGIIWADLWDPRTETHELRGYCRIARATPPLPEWDFGVFRQLHAGPRWEA